MTYTSFYHWFHNSRGQYTSTADILVMENTVSLYASKYCTTWMCSVKNPIYYDQIVFQLYRSKQGSSEISEQWHTAVLMWPSYFIYQHKYQQTSTNIQDYGVFCKAVGRLQLSRLTLTRRETTRRPFPSNLNISYPLEDTSHTIQAGHRLVTHTHQQFSNNLLAGLVTTYCSPASSKFLSSVVLLTFTFIRSKLFTHEFVRSPQLSRQFRPTKLEHPVESGQHILSHPDCHLR